MRTIGDNEFEIHNLWRTTDPIYFQLTVFLNRFTGPPIGLTAAGMFVVDKSTILTVLCTFIVEVYHLMD